jgi:hypothetical protein
MTLRNDPSKVESEYEQDKRGLVIGEARMSQTGPINDGRVEHVRENKRKLEKSHFVCSTAQRRAFKAKRVGYQKSPQRLLSSR